MIRKKLKISIISVFILLAILSFNSDNQDADSSLGKFRLKDHPAQDDAYYVDSSLVTYSDEFVYNGKETSFLDDVLDDTGHINHSYTIMKSAAYLNQWKRAYVYFLPDFTVEIPYEEGRSTIQSYYRELADQTIRSVEESVQNAFIDGHAVLDVSTDRNQYQGQNYSVSYIGDYLSVKYISFGYYGGAHPAYSSTADNFDMRTGRLLATEDVFVTGEDANALLQVCIETYAKLQGISLSSYDTQVDNSLNFYFSEDGVCFVFNPYELGSWGDGIREVIVPYEKLKPILRIIYG